MGTTSFNVMDFLDGILEEPSSSQIESEDSLLSPSDSQDADPTTTTSLSSPGAVSLNPWAPQSRASRFGIALEEDDGGDIVFEEPEILDAILATSTSALDGNSSSVRLLTPAAILSTGGDTAAVLEEGEEEEVIVGKGSSSYGLRGSFYSNLLGEGEQE
uniref:Uncharacterized protein n=1 Tax=Grammatophora oceanica TaxID=210454 RepID=A0A7S1Y9U5_9STRA